MSVLCVSCTWVHEEQLLPGVCVAFVLSKHNMAVLISSPEEKGSIMKEKLNMGESKSMVREREGRETARLGSCCR